MAKKNPKPTKRMFLKFVDPFRNIKHCWVWLGPRTGGPTKKNPGAKKYGAYCYNNKALYAHRLAYELFVGPIPEGMFVCHHCDNEICVNPKHLFLGTNQDNMTDMRKKGRGSSKLTVQQVKELRLKYAKGDTSFHKLGIEYGVNKNTVDKAVRGQRFKWVPSIEELLDQQTKEP